MQAPFLSLLRRFGQEVLLHHQGQTRSVKAFLQPIRSSQKPQVLPTPLGLQYLDRLLYLGPESLPLEGCLVEWNGRCYRPQSVHPIPLGGHISHIWAILSPEE